MMHRFAPHSDHPPAPQTGALSFDVLIAILSARQATSPTARRVLATTGSAPETAVAGDLARRALFTGAARHSRTGVPARFADLACGEELVTQMNVPFTRAFEGMLKADAISPAKSTGGVTSAEFKLG